MAKKKGLAAYKKTKRAKKNNAIVKARSNPPALQDLAEFVIPGFAGYAGTRLVSRVVHGVVLKKSPRFAKHASVASALIAAAGTLVLAHRWKKTEEHAAPLIVGASIAAVQTVVQAYIPKYGWIVSDHNLSAQTPAQASQPQTASANFGTVNRSQPSNGGALPPPIATLSKEQISDELDDLDMGVLTSNIGAELSDADMDAMIDDANFN
jgi:hypothetical protein